MNNLGLFFQFGIRMQGGPAFLKRIREAVSQLQSRTSSASLVNQLQTRTRSISTTFTNRNDGYVCPGITTEGYYGYWAGGNLNCNSSTCNQSGYYCTDFGFTDCRAEYGSYIKCLEYRCICNTSYSAYGEWTNTTSCTPSDTRQCQTIQVYQFGPFTPFADVSSCTPSSPPAGAGAVITECQTLYNWGSFSAYEEVDICVPQTPALGAGAIEIECVPQ
jgi:hypothetical protein